MFNIMVSAADNAWEEGAYAWDRTRILEHSDDAIKEAFRGLGSEELEQLAKLPTLFMYERGTDGTPRVGIIKRIQQRGGEFRVIFEFDDAVPTLSFEQIDGLKWELQLSDFEFSRTHWAVKDGDLYDILRQAGIIAQAAPVPVLVAAEPAVDVTPAKVFLVHGRDDAAKFAVARFLERRVGLDVILLSERPNRGRSLLTKFQEEADGASFAVVLVTGDDLGHLRPELADGRLHDPTRRARQNVIFELGFFIGKLGVRNVCALVAPAVETPSDYDGVVYIPLDEHDGWQRSLVTELHTANVPVRPTWWQI